MALQIMGGAPVEKEKESDYDKVAKALSIVQGLTGTAMNLVQFKDALASSKLKAQQGQQMAEDQKTARDEFIRKQKGIKTPGEFQDLQLGGDVTAAKEGEQGAIPVQVQGPDGSPLIQFVKSTKGQPKLPTESQQKNINLRERQVMASEEKNKLERDKLQDEAEGRKRKQSASQATIKANLQNLDGIIASLSPGKDGKEAEVTTGRSQALIPGPLRALVSPKTQDVRDRVVNIVFQSLKAALGGQFTQKEAEQLVDSELNLSLPNEYNIPRLQRLRERIAAASNDPSLAGELKSGGGGTDEATRQKALEILKKRGAL